MRTRLAPVALLLVLAACGGGRSDQSAATTAPSTTPTTTSTTAAPAKASPRAEKFVAAFTSAGLPVAEQRDYDAASDPNEQLGRPGGYTSKTSWRDSRLEVSEDFDVDGGGSVEVFATTGDAQKRYDYVDAITRGNAMLNEYHWLIGTAFVRVSKSFTPAQAGEYEAAARKVS